MLLRSGRPAQPRPGDYDVRGVRLLRRGDRVRIYLRAIPSPEDLSDEVDEQGCITLPYLGQMMVEGKTTSRVEAEVAKAYVAGEIYAKIDVIVVVEADEYYVRGQVKGEGRYALARDMTLMQAIAAAGGYTDFAGPRVQVIRGQTVLNFNMKRIERRKDPDPLIAPRDIIVVRRRWLWW